MGAEARWGAPDSIAAGKRFPPAAAVLFAATLVVALCGGAAAAGEWGPWPAGDDFPVLASPGVEDRPAGRAAAPDGTAGAALIALVRVYQAWLSPVYGSRCRMLPSCSRYAVDAIRKHGPVVGTVMASGRLMHEPDEWRFAPIRISGGGYLFFDPVENNDFWFGAR